MGMKISGSGLSHENGEVKVAESMLNLNEKEKGNFRSGNGNIEPLMLGFHGLDKSTNVKTENASKFNFPKDAAVEGLAEPQVHSFYIVKFRTYDEPILKAKIDQADKEIVMRNRQRLQILDRLKAKRSDRAQVIGQFKSLGAESNQYGHVLDEKINQIKPLKEALGRLRGSNNAGRERTGLCSSEEELNKLIQSLNYRMQHKAIPLTEEKEILRNIKQLEGTREKVIAYATMRAKFLDSFGQKDAIHDQVKLIGTGLDGVKKERQAVRSKIKLLEDELKAIDSDIFSLQIELTSILEKRDKAFEDIQQLRKQRDEGNTCFFQNRTVLNSAKELAGKKNIKALEELACSEVEKFMSSWNNSKPFRDDYEKRVLPSLDMRRLSRDGRIRNPSENRLIFVENAKPAEAESVEKPALKVVKEDAKPPKEEESVSEEKAQKEPEANQTESAAEPQAVEEEEHIVVGKPKEENDIDKANLKEIKRQEEMEKQKLALERKKKLAEKTAAKAALKAQKEAEKKQKEREKKLKKKESTSGYPSSQDAWTENEAEEEAKESKEGSTKNKYREKRQAKRRDNAVAKVIMQRRKSNNVWVWAGIGGAVLAILLALLYKFAL